MNVSDLSKFLKEKSNVTLNSVFIPTLNKNVLFKSFTVSDVKSAAKLKLSSNVSTKAIMCGLASSVTDEELDLNKLIMHDIILALIQLRTSSFDEDKYIGKCIDCNKDYVYYVQWDEICKNIYDSYNLMTSSKNDDNCIKLLVGDMKIKINLKSPSILKCLKYEEIYNNAEKNIFSNEELNASKEDKEEAIKEIELLKMVYEPLLYIDSIYVNDENIEGVNDFENVNEIIDMFHTLPSDTIIKVMSLVKNSKYLDVDNSMKFTCRCTTCGKDSIKRLSQSTFFQTWETNF